MKKVLILTIVTLVGAISTTQAQIEKGNVMWGGDLMGMNFGLNKGGGYNISINPKLAYFIKDNLAVGGYAQFGISGAKGSPSDIVYKVGGLGRYYLSPGEKGIDNLLQHGRFFVEANLGFGGETITKGGASSNGINLQFGPGYAYFITPNVALEGLLKYDGTFGFGNVGAVSNINFGLGFQVYLPSQKVKNIIKNPSQL